MKPKKKTNSGEGSFHDPLQRKWLRLGEVINLARGATDDLKRDWPPPEPWLGHFKDLKAAVEYSELQVARPPILADKRTPVSLENLSAFAVRQDALWGWLRDFCQRWRAARGNVLEETEKPRGHTSTRNPWTQPRTDYWKNRKTEILRDPKRSHFSLYRVAKKIAGEAAPANLPDGEKVNWKRKGWTTANILRRLKDRPQSLAGTKKTGQLPHG